MAGERIYAVIGSNSFTGSYVINALLDLPENRVVGISRSPEKGLLYLPYKSRALERFTFVQLDSVRQGKELIELFDQLKPAVIVNVAALSEVGLSNSSPVEYFQINTRAVVALCNELRTRRYLSHYVHISSAEILGNCEQPMDETSLFDPSTPYAVSKAAADMYIQVLIKNFGFPALLIRSTNVYGKHQQLYKIIPRTIMRLKLGNKIELHGGGKAIKSFIHITDVVRGLMLALEHCKVGTYHFTVSSEDTIADVVRQICTWMGFDFESVTKVVGERLGQDARYWLDCSKASRELHWKPRVTFKAGTEEVIAWIEENWNRIKEEPLIYIHKV